MWKLILLWWKLIKYFELIRVIINFFYRNKNNMEFIGEGVWDKFRSGKGRGWRIFFYFWRWVNLIIFFGLLVLIYWNLFLYFFFGYIVIEYIVYFFIE